MTKYQIPKGYKQTELGIIPEDWEVSQIGKILSIITGGKNTQDNVEDGIYPFFVRSQQVERINTYSYDGEGVLTAGDGVGTGKIFHYINGKFDFHQRVYLMHNFSNQILGYYFFLFFRYYFYNRIMSMTAKSSVDSIRRDMISNMSIILPPKPEQEAIARVLSDVDGLINRLKVLIDKKQAMKTATMQQLLTGKTRLPAFQNNPDGTPKSYKQSELGNIPEDWEVKRLGDILNIYAAGDLDKNHFSRQYDNVHCYPIYSNSLLHKGLYGYSSFYQYSKNCITITARGNLGFCFFRDEEFNAIGRLLVLIPSVKVNCQYITEYLNLYVQFNNETTSIAQLTIPKVIDTNCLCPPLPEQETIATILSDMDHEINALKEQLTKTEKIKQGMMQELLTGKTRLLTV